VPQRDPQRTPNRTPIRTSETDSHERTNERTDGDTGDGRLSGHGSRRTGAYEDSRPTGDERADHGKPGQQADYHSDAVAYYLELAREAIRQASAEHHKRDTTPTRVQPVRAAIAARKEEDRG
jgi:hypothetical protein